LDSNFILACNATLSYSWKASVSATRGQKLIGMLA